MGKTSIEWTDASWNPIVGCTEISPGCANCYAARLAATRLRNTPQYKGLATIRPSMETKAIGELAHPRWTGELNVLPDRFDEPLHWRKPRRIFVCDMGDLFHESVTDEQIIRVFKTIALGGGLGHTFQVLTKRAQRMHDFMRTDFRLEYVRPMPWMWLGVSVENQRFADERIPLLLDTPAALRWISAEPLLGSIGIRRFLFPAAYERPPISLDWIVCGGESGPNARPMRPEWAGALRDQAMAARVPFFFKQWGEWFPNGQDRARDLPPLSRAGEYPVTNMGDQIFVKLSKKKSGRLLYGREWNQFPHAHR